MNIYTMTNDNGFTRLNNREMTRNGRYVEFTPAEYDILRTLQNGQSITRPQLATAGFENMTSYVRVNGQNMTRYSAIIEELVQRKWARRHENNVITWNGEGKI